MVESCTEPTTKPHRLSTENKNKKEASLIGGFFMRDGK